MAAPQPVSPQIGNAGNEPMCKATRPSAAGHGDADRAQGIFSVQFSRSVVSDSLRPHEPQNARPPCPSSTPGIHPNTCPLSQGCHPAISSSVIPSSSCPQSFPTSRSFQLSQLFVSGSQSTGVSALASVLPKKSQG